MTTERSTEEIVRRLREDDGWDLDFERGQQTDSALLNAAADHLEQMAAEIAALRLHIDVEEALKSRPRKFNFTQRGEERSHDREPVELGDGVTPEDVMSVVRETTDLAYKEAEVRGQPPEGARVSLSAFMVEWLWQERNAAADRLEALARHAKDTLDSSFITKCFLRPREGDGPLFEETPTGVTVRLNGYAVIPREDWVALRGGSGGGDPTEWPCLACGANGPTAEGHDPCIARLPGVKYACCGHGRGGGWIVFTDGRVMRGVVPELSTARATLEGSRPEDRG